MADKPIKLTDAQLTTLKQVADPNYYSNPKLEHNSFYQYSATILYQLECDGLVHITDAQNDEIVNDAIVPCWVHLTPAGRAHLDALGIAPVALQPPPKTDKERIAELEAEVKALRQAAVDALYEVGFHEALEEHLANLYAGSELERELVIAALAKGGH